MQLYLFQTALQDFLRIKRVVVWLFVVLGVFGAAKAWSSLTTSIQPAEAYGQLSQMLVFRLTALAAAIFSTAVISAEIEQKTIVYLLTRPIQRWKLLLGRLLAASVATMIVSWLALFAVALAVYGVNGLAQNLFWKDLLTVAVGALTYCALFVLISLWLNRSLIVCLLFAFGWETAVPNMPGDIYYLSIYSYLTAIAEHPALEVRGAMALLSGQLGVNTMSSSTAWTIVLLLIFFCVSLGSFWFSHFEYLPREDGD